MRVRLGRGLSVANDASWRMGRRARQRGRAATPGAKVIVAILLALLIAPIAYHVLTLVVPLPLWSGTESFCGKHSLGCDLATHLLGDIVFAVILYALFLRRQLRTATVWRNRARQAPDEVFSWLGPVSGGLTEIAAESATKGGPLATLIRDVTPDRLRRSSPIVESILGRDELVREIADDLENGGEPQVIVANSAAGKTMVLVKLADYVARRGHVPVAISLQGHAHLDFERIAWQAFEYASPSGDEEDLKKQWGELRQRGQIVVLADDLDKAEPTVKPPDVANAIEDARRQKLPLVAASRPYGIPVDFKQGRVDLEPLHDRDVRRDLLKLMRSHSDSDRRLGRSSAEAVGRAIRSSADAVGRLVRPSSHADGDDQDPEQLVAKLVADAEISVTPYYLSVARVLGKLGKLTAPPDDGDARLWLLNAYRTGLEMGDVRPDAELSAGRRGVVLKDLEAIAFVRVWGTRQESAIITEVESLGLSHIDVEWVLDDARRLGVVEASHDGLVQFAHPTTLAYFASCFLVEHVDDRSCFELIMHKGWGPYRALALILATKAAHDSELARYICKRLLQLSSTGNGAGAGWLTSAIEIARCGSSLDNDAAESVLAKVQSELDGTRQFGQAQIGMLKALGKLCRRFQVPEAYEALWKYATEGGDYTFRRQAIKALAEGKDVIDSLLPTIEDVMDNAERFARSLTEPVVDDRGPVFDSLTAVAWILPSLRGVADDEKPMLDRYQDDLLTYSKTLSFQRGLEAAIAQGLKFDAVRESSLPPDPFAIVMLGDRDQRAEFWFSRVLLLQALARRCAQDESDETFSVISAALHDEHPFVRRTAKLCLRALVDDKPERFLFEDLTDVAGRAPYDLAAATSQLIGDMVLALNLNEYGDARSRIAFGTASSLPGCLTARPDRRPILLLNSPRPLCPFAEYQEEGCLCPYTRDYPPNTNRRELSRAFCRHQRLNTRRLPWNRRVSPRELRQFWAAMENRARY